LRPPPETAQYNIEALQFVPAAVTLASAVLVIHQAILMTCISPENKKARLRGLFVFWRRDGNQYKQ